MGAWPKQWVQKGVREGGPFAAYQGESFRRAQATLKARNHLQIVVRFLTTLHFQRGFPGNSASDKLECKGKRDVAPRHSVFASASTSFLAQVACAERGPRKKRDE